MDEKVIPVEGHTKWLLDLVPYLEEGSNPQNQCEDGFFSRLLKKNKVASVAGWNEWSSILAHKMNSMAILTLDDQHIGKEKSLIEELNELLTKNLRPATDIQREVMFYCKNVLKWKLEGGEDGDAFAKRLNKKWEALMNEGNEVTAMVAFLKGRLALELGMDLDKVKAFYLEAIELDTECLAWYNHAYLAAREIRRDEGGPSKIEQDLAETAYKLRYGKRKEIIAEANYAIMCKEFWMEKRKHFWGDNPEMYSKCVEYFENALQFAEGDWLLKIKIHLADFLYFGKGTEQDVLRGLSMFLELEREHPGSVSVAHKVGKRYFEKGNLRKARECYERALKLNPSDVSCVMDYIELLSLKMGVGEQNEIVRILRRALSPNYEKSDEDNAKLQTQLDLVIKNIEDAEAEEGDSGEDSDEEN